MGIEVSRDLRSGEARLWCTNETNVGMIYR